MWVECTIRFQLLRQRIKHTRDIKKEKRNPVRCHACIEKIMNSIIRNTKVLLIEKKKFISVCMHAGANALFGWKVSLMPLVCHIRWWKRVLFSIFFSLLLLLLPAIFFFIDAFVVGDVFFCNFDYDWNKTQFSVKQLSSIHKSTHNKTYIRKKRSGEGTQLLNIQSWLNKFYSFFVYVELLFVYILYISNNQNAVNYKLKYKLKLNINFGMDENKYEK